MMGTGHDDEERDRLEDVDQQVLLGQEGVGVERTEEGDEPDEHGRIVEFEGDLDPVMAQGVGEVGEEHEGGETGGGGEVVAGRHPGAGPALEVLAEEVEAGGDPLQTVPALARAGEPLTGGRPDATAESYGSDTSMAASQPGVKPWPIGSNADARRVDVRVIATTNRDLETEVKEGRFRLDLFYRLNVIPLQLPPLRDRKNDIPMLAEHYLKMGMAKVEKIKLPEPYQLETLCKKILVIGGGITGLAEVPARCKNRDQ